MGLGVHASISDERFLLFLDELTAATADCSQAVYAGIALHAIFVLHVSSLDELEDRRETAGEEKAVGDALLLD